MDDSRVVFDEPVVLVFVGEVVGANVAHGEQVPVVAVRGVQRQLGFLKMTSAAGEFGHLGFDEYIPVGIVFEDQGRLDSVAHHSVAWVLK